MAMYVRWKAKQLRLQRSARLGREVQQAEVAQEVGMSVAALSNIENNKMKGVTFDTLARLAEFYGVTKIDDLLELTTEQPVEKPAPGLVGAALSSAY